MAGAGTGSTMNQRKNWTCLVDEGDRPAKLLVGAHAPELQMRKPPPAIMAGTARGELRRRCGAPIRGREACEFDSRPRALPLGFSDGHGRFRSRPLPGLRLQHGAADPDRSGLAYQVCLLRAF